MNFGAQLQRSPDAGAGGRITLVIDADEELVLDGFRVAELTADAHVGGGVLSGCTYCGGSWRNALTWRYEVLHEYITGGGAVRSSSRHADGGATGRRVERPGQVSPGCAGAGTGRWRSENSRYVFYLAQSIATRAT